MTACVKQTVRFCSFCLIVALGVGSGTQAADERSDKLRGLRLGSDVARFRIEAPTKALLDSIAESYEIVGRSGQVFDFYVPIAKAKDIERRIPGARVVLEHQSDGDIHRSFSPFDGLFGSKDYRTYETVQADVAALAKANPNYARLTSYGKSQDGKPLLLLELSDNPGKIEPGEPRLLITAATHGDEQITTETLLLFLEELLGKLATDPQTKTLLDNHQLFFIPVVNPDGYAKQERYDHGIDPNRVYPWPERPDAGKSLASIDALKALFEREKFQGSIDLHAFGEMVMYPWAYTGDPLSNAPARTAFDELTTAMAGPLGYRHGQISRTIYIAKGSSADYYFWKFGTLAVAVELGHQKMPPKREFAAYLSHTRTLILTFIEHFSGANLFATLE